MEVGQDLSLYETQDQNASAIQIQTDSLLSESNLQEDEFVSTEPQLLPMMNPSTIAGLSGCNISIDSLMNQSHLR